MIDELLFFNKKPEAFPLYEAVRDMMLYNHPRVMESVKPYPSRWTHHVVIQNVDEVDEQIKAWLNEAYAFSLMK